MNDFRVHHKSYNVSRLAKLPYANEISVFGSDTSNDIRKTSDRCLVRKASGEMSLPVREIIDT